MMGSLFSSFCIICQEGRVLYFQFGYWNDEREEEEEKEEENGMLVSDGGGLGFHVSFLFLFFSDS